jgi:L-tryptophan---pyruvate aminotransferase
MAAFRLGTAVEGKSPARLLAANHREEPANGGGAARPVGALRPKKKFQAGKPRKRSPIWEAGVLASVALNVVLLLRRHEFVVSNLLGAAPAHQHRNEHQACLAHPEAGSGGKESTAGQKGAVLTQAPSTGKPAVTPDSVINLDQ